MKQNEKQLMAFVVNGMKPQAARQASLMTSNEVLTVTNALYELINDEIWDNGNDELKAKFQALIG